MGLLRKFWQILPRSYFLTIYKVFTRSRLGYAYIIYDHAYNSIFYDKVAITGAIRGTLTEKIYQELGLGLAKLIFSFCYIPEEQAWRQH